MNNPAKKLMHLNQCGIVHTVLQSPFRDLGLHQSHPVCIHRGLTQFGYEPIVYDYTNRRSNDGDQLSHLRNVEIVAIFLLKRSPVKGVNIIRQ